MKELTLIFIIANEYIKCLTNNEIIKSFGTNDIKFVLNETICRFNFNTSDHFVKSHYIDKNGKLIIELDKKCNHV